MMHGLAPLFVLPIKTNYSIFTCFIGKSKPQVYEIKIVTKCTTLEKLVEPTEIGDR